MTKRKLQIVSNRLPLKVKIEDNELVYTQSSGGLVSGLRSLEESMPMVWTGWPGIYHLNKSQKKEVIAELEKHQYQPVFLSPSDYKNYYEGFSNKTIWPLFHYFCQFAEYNPVYWKVYQKVNEIFRDHLIAHASEDDIFWIHDYHLMLLPQMLRKRWPNAQIGFFLHIPFPHREVFRNLPWRKEILDGLSSADLVGFHTQDYASYFIETLKEEGMEFYNENTFYDEDGFLTEVDDFPLGIDYQTYAEKPEEEKVGKLIAQYREELKGERIMISVDRMDYSKGILQRVKAFKLFLERHPSFRKKVVLIILSIPSRTGVDQYQYLKEEIDEYIGRINGKFGTPFWTPIHYLYRTLNLDQLSALYAAADVALVTPFRDGMNMVAKEFVANKHKGDGVLILSEFAGSAKELREALLVNPNDVESITRAMERALSMGEEEKLCRMRRMNAYLKRHTAKDWASDFLTHLKTLKERQQALQFAT